MPGSTHGGVLSLHPYTKVQTDRNSFELNYPNGRAEPTLPLNLGTGYVRLDPTSNNGSLGERSLDQIRP